MRVMRIVMVMVVVVMVMVITMVMVVVRVRGMVMLLFCVLCILLIGRLLLRILGAFSVCLVCFC